MGGCERRRASCGETHRVPRRLRGLPRGRARLGRALRRCCSSSRSPRTAHAEWDHTGAPAPAEGCNTDDPRRGNPRRALPNDAVRRSCGSAGGRLLATTLSGLAGTCHPRRREHRQRRLRRGAEEAIQDCATTTRSFRAWNDRLSAAIAPGSLTLRPVRNVRLRAITCPLEPVEVVRAPLGPIHGPLQAPDCDAREQALHPHHADRVHLAEDELRARRAGNADAALELEVHVRADSALRPVRAARHLVEVPVGRAEVRPAELAGRSDLGDVDARSA